MPFITSFEMMQAIGQLLRGWLLTVALASTVHRPAFASSTETRFVTALEASSSSAKSLRKPRAFKAALYMPHACRGVAISGNLLRLRGAAGSGRRSKHQESGGEKRGKDHTKAGVGHREKTSSESAPHRKPGASKCGAAGCKTKPIFGEVGVKGGPRFCAKHKSPEHRDVVNKKCAHDGCMKAPTFVPKGEKTLRFCSQHRSPGAHPHPCCLLIGRGQHTRQRIGEVESYAWSGR